MVGNHTGNTGASMTEWIQSHTNLPRHRKTKKLARTLEVPILPDAVGYLHALWWYAAEFFPSGDLSNIDEDDLAESCGWQGEPATFLKAFITAGFVDKDKTVHDWLEYNRQHRERVAAADRQRKWRLKQDLLKEGKTEEEANEILDGPGEPTQPPRPRTAKDIAKSNGNPYVALYVDTFREKGYPDPSKRQKEVFGAKTKQIESQMGELDMALLAAAIDLMIERDKGPGLLAYLYKDAKQIAAEVDLKDRMGGRVR